jgi:hypothetical protein
MSSLPIVLAEVLDTELNWSQTLSTIFSDLRLRYVVAPSCFYVAVRIVATDAFVPLLGPGMHESKLWSSLSNTLVRSPRWEKYSTLPPATFFFARKIHTN